MTGQEAPPLEEDQGGGFKGSGGITKTSGARQLQLCLELAEGGLAQGDLRSVELTDSSAPLLLSLEAQRRLGLVLDLNRDLAYSQTLDQELRLVHYKGIFGIRLLPGNFAGLAELPEEPLDFVDATDGEKTIGEADTRKQDAPLAFLSFDEMSSHILTKGLIANVKNHVDGVKGRGQVMLNQVCRQKVDRRLCLPRGCKTFLLRSLLDALCSQAWPTTPTASLSRSRLTSSTTTTMT